MNPWKQRATCYEFFILYILYTFFSKYIFLGIKQHLHSLSYCTSPITPLANFFFEQFATVKVWKMLRQTEKVLVWIPWSHYLLIYNVNTLRTMLCVSFFHSDAHRLIQLSFKRWKCKLILHSNQTPRTNRLNDEAHSYANPNYL